MKKLMLIIVTISMTLLSQTNPVVSNVNMSINGTTVTVNYDVSDGQQETVTIGMSVSSDQGITWDYNYGTASGDIGTGISTGTDKQITWTYSGGPQDFIVMITANDEQVGGDNCGKVYYEGGPNNDIEGDYYNTIMIGNQCWLKENLNVGTRINGNQEQTNNSVIEKYCYNDLESNCDTYGGLYQWAETVQYLNGASNTASPDPAFSGNVIGICPPGWHIPSLAELQNLKAIVNNNSNELKTVGEGSGDGAGTNTSGFSALLAGSRAYFIQFGGLGLGANFWSSTVNGNNHANRMNLLNNDSNISLTHIIKSNGIQVRCVKD